MTPSPSSASPRALVVEDHPLTRRSLVGVLVELGFGEVIEVESAGAALAVAAAGPLDLAVLDLRLPDRPGMELVAELHAAGWARLLVLSASDEPHVVRGAYQAGALGYLHKSAGPETIAEAVRTVMEGRSFADQTVAALLVEGLQSGVPAGATSLSDRERALVSMLAKGLSNREIGELLDVPSATVKTMLAKLGRQLGTGDRAEMVAVAMRSGWVD